MTWHTGLLGAMLLLAALGIMPQASHANYCPNNWGKWQQMPIAVHLNEHIADDLCPNSSCSTLSDIERTLRAVLSEYYYASGSTLQFEYKGTTSTPALENVPGAVHIYAYPCSGSTLGIAVANGDASPPYGRIRMCESNDSGPIPWNSFDDDGSGYSFHQVLLHELGHVIGLDHIETCADAEAENAVMNQYYNTSGSDHLMYQDLNFVRNEYNPRLDTVSRRHSTDGLSWQELANTTLENFTDVRGRVAVSNAAANGSDLVMAWTHLGAWGFTNIAAYSSLGWTTLGNFWTFSVYHPGVAKRSNADVGVSYMTVIDSLTHDQKVEFRRTRDGGASWDAPIELSDAATRTRNAGISAAFDRGSLRYITVWRGSGNNKNAIIYRVQDGATPYVLADPSGTPITASDTPSIACGEPSVVGADNCLIVWPSARSWSRVVQWTQGHIAGDQLVLRPLKTHGYVTSGSPTVAYAYGSNAVTAYPWHLTLVQGGQTVYTWRKGGAYTSNFVDQRSFSESPQASLPVAGATHDGDRWTVVTDQSPPPPPPPPPCPSGERCCEPVPNGCHLCVPDNAECP
jgi:Matrixin